MKSLINHNGEIMSKFSVNDIISSLKKKRKAFVSEADFQLELAWEIQEKYKEKAQVFCEYVPFFDTSMHIDILVIMGKEWIPIELKYKTRKANVEIYDPLSYQLKEQGAKDHACYDYLKDISRIEEIKQQLENSEDYTFEQGYAIFLTNQHNYKDEPNKSVMYYNFSVFENRIIEKEESLAWNGKPSAGTTAKREKPIILKNKYEFNWTDYNDDFCLLINRIQ